MTAGPDLIAKIVPLLKLIPMPEMLMTNLQRVWEPYVDVIRTLS
jgi:hypothetical protein